MSIESIGARIAELDARMSALRAGPAAPSTDFAGALQSAQATTAATPTATAASVGAGAVPYAAQIEAAAQKHGIDPALLKGLIRQESNFDPNARSPAGATGLTQLMPGTAASLGVTDPSDPAQAIEGGAAYLAAQLQRFGGDASKALGAYNAGPGAVAKYGGVPPYAETQNYVKNVLAYADRYRGTSTTAATPVSAVPLTTTPVAPLSTTTASGALGYSTT